MFPTRLVPEAPIDLVRRMRASILVLGALLNDAGRPGSLFPAATTSGRVPSTCTSTVSRRWAPNSNLCTVSCARATGGLRGAEVSLDFPSVGATENVLFAGVMAREPP